MESEFVSDQTEVTETNSLLYLLQFQVKLKIYIKKNHINVKGWNIILFYTAIKKKYIYILAQKYL